MAGLNPDWARDFLSVHAISGQSQFDNVFHSDLQPLRHLRADEHGIVPDELVHRLGQFLQPAVVGELTIVDGGVGADVELDGAKVVAGGLPAPVPVCDCFSRKWTALDPSVVQRFTPELFEICACVLLLPVSADQIVSCGIRLARKQRDEFYSALATVERRDQRLNDADGSVASSPVTPRLEFVRLIDMPLTKFRCFVLIEPKMYAQWHLAVLQAVGKIEIGRRIISRIAVENYQQIDFSGAHVADEIFDGFGLAYRVCVDGVTVENCPAFVAQPSIHRMGKTMHTRRLMISRQHNA